MKKNIKKVLLATIFFLSLLVSAGCFLFENSDGIESVYQGLFKSVDTNHLQKNFSLPLTVDDVSISYASSNESSLSVTSDSKANFTVHRTTENVSLSIKVTLTAKNNNIEKVKNVTVLKEGTVFDFIAYPFYNEMTLFNKAVKSYIGLPYPTAEKDSKVNQKILVLPVEFSDHSFNGDDLYRLGNAFFGTPETTGYESVRSYYERASYGKVIFDAQIMEPYKLSHDTSYYENLNKASYAEQTILKEIISYYNSTVDFSEYDTDKDGNIDGIYMIYAAPVVYQISGYPGYDADKDFWWAWCYSYQSRIESYDRVRLGNYVWAGIDFLDDILSTDGITELIVEANAVTYIHETGHMFGLEDYYDYDDNIGPSGGLGGADMMDSNYGDHASFSKIILGWTVPEVVTDSISIRIKPFEESGNVILIPRDWNSTYFTEYLLIDYYTPTGLNEPFAGKGLYSISGVRIYHINAELGSNSGSYRSPYSYDNSDEKYKLIKLVEAEGRNLIEDYDGYLNTQQLNSILFQSTSTFNFRNYSWYNRAKLLFDIKVSDMTETGVTISITF